ncbi:hypothetical protein ACN38_g12096 [Penicillium nordicum]|uniref:Uncharacterized protein n=2 Tax=Penicillium nordicum TaxID=229535 RepID=A0A0M8NQ62_9EURO|nr:hypothetical protein ACN38_g12096 [Penicillium nordicum]
MYTESTDGYRKKRTYEALPRFGESKVHGLRSGIGASCQNPIPVKVHALMPSFGPAEELKYLNYHDTSNKVA